MRTSTTLKCLALALFLSVGQSVAQDTEIANQVDTSEIWRWTSEAPDPFWQQLFTKRYGMIADSEGDLFSEISRISNAVGMSWRYDIRADLYDRATELVGMLDQSGTLLSDPFLDDYMHTLLLQVFGYSLPPGRTGGLRVFILADATPFSYSLANGTILINSGLIARLRTEEELLSVITHEVAHVMLDHLVEAEAEAQKNAEELARQAQRRANTAAVFVAISGALASKKLGGNAFEMISAAAYTGAVGAAVVSAYSQDRARRLAADYGASFTSAQEKEADIVAMAWLEENGFNPMTLGAGLKRLTSYGSAASTGSEIHLLSSGVSPKSRIDLLVGTGQKSYVTRSVAIVTYGSAVDSVKIEALNTAYQTVDRYYDAQVADVLLMTARLAADVNRDYSEASSLLGRVLDTGSAPSSAYVLASRIQRYLGDSDEINQRANTFLTKAKEVSSGTNWELLIEDALVAQRLGEKERAITSLKELLALDWTLRPFEDYWIQDQIEKLSFQ